jgi:hypothetical protein
MWRHISLSKCTNIYPYNPLRLFNSLSLSLFLSLPPHFPYALPLPYFLSHGCPSSLSLPLRLIAAPHREGAEGPVDARIDLMSLPTRGSARRRIRLYSVPCGNSGGGGPPSQWAPA